MSKNEQFSVLYHIAADSIHEAATVAQRIAVEQTIEFPVDLVNDRYILDTVVGKLGEITLSDNRDGYLAWISYSLDVVGMELTQLLNVIFGNSSMQPGIRVEDLRLPDSLLALYKGPRFGVAGVRKLARSPIGPLLHGAIKPLGSSVRALARMAYDFARGGAHFIKDDHGITDQRYAPFAERVAACAEAVRKANDECGGSSVYIANCTADGGQAIERARLAKKLGAGGVMVAPGLIGYSQMKAIAEDDTIGLPVIAHPTFQGGFVLPSMISGIGPAVLFGLLSRLAGADIVIFPSFGGRFTFGREDCRKLAAATQQLMGHIRTNFPCPAGGLTENTLPEVMTAYGENVIYLVVGGIFRHGPDLVENTAYFRNLINERNR